MIRKELTYTRFTTAMDSNDSIDREKQYCFQSKQVNYWGKLLGRFGLDKKITDQYHFIIFNSEVFSNSPEFRTYTIL